MLIASRNNFYSSSRHY